MMTQMAAMNSFVELMVIALIIQRLTFLQALKSMEPMWRMVTHMPLPSPEHGALRTLQNGYSLLATEPPGLGSLRLTCLCLH
jgi:hypothetical protein